MSRRLFLVLITPLLVAVGVAVAVTRSSQPPARHAAICHDERTCEPVGGPESLADLRIANTSRATRALAPSTALKPGAQRAAAAQASALPTTGAAWKAFGNTPLQGNNTDYDTNTGSTREGLPGLSGRVTAFTRDDAGTLYAAVSYGGIWKSADNAATWTSIGEGLPTQVSAGVAWTPANGGTIIALTGDNSYGGGTASGLGAYYTRDGGKTWKRSDGIPDGVLGFRLAVDPTDTTKVYAATGGGLFRSTDGGASFTNVNLPTGDCAGKGVDVKNCGLANMVTDVVVQGAKNTQTASGKPGAVMAAVGWRAGNAPNANGVPQSPGNGIYTSDTGAPGSFKNMDMPNHATPVPPSGNDPLTQARVGRIALGIADGAAQNHQVVYAIVQDAVKFNGGIAGLDASENKSTSVAQSDYLNGIWVSTDFGASWKQLEGSSTIDNDTTSGSALAPPTCKAPAVIGYCPGIQAWYNLWVLPDPTRQTAAGVPTRVLFGLEEVWANNPSATPPTGLDGSTSTKFDVIGRYFADKTCTLLNATNGLPFCPATVAQGGAVPKTTTHPDQHGSFFVPDGKGGVTFYSGNDGGVFSQHTDDKTDFAQGGWGNGNNQGLNTLLPYDAVMAKDGTVYMGLQDNGEGKIEPDGKAYTVFGGDGFFTAVDPDDSKVAYEEYVGGVMSKTVDGGKTWNSVDPGLTSPQFSTPFEMDPASAQHLVIGGRDIEETTDGATTWNKVYDLGTQKKPGDANAGSDPTADDGPDNQVSAVDVLGSPPVVTGKTGPPTKDFGYSGGPLAPNPTPGLSGQDTFIPGTYDDHPFTIAPGDNDGLMTIETSWDDPSGGSQDYDTYLYKKQADGSLKKISDSATSANPEKISVQAPAPGDYVMRVSNFTAANPFTVKVTFTQGAGQAVTDKPYPTATYVGFCGYCDVLTQGTPFNSGIATNVAGDKPGMTNSSDGWHIATAANLPKRYITSVRMDPSNPKTVYVTLGGYARKWAAPGAIGDDTSKIGSGHVFKSTDAGGSFTDISGNLPDTPADWTVLRNGRLIVGTDLGVFISSTTSRAAGGPSYARLGTGMPNVQTSTLRFKPGDPDLLYAATYGRGVYTYQFAKSAGTSGSSKSKSPAASAKGAKCRAAVAANLARAKPVAKRHRLRFTIPRSKRRDKVDIFQVSNGRRIFRERLVARFTRRSGPFTWSGKANRRGRKVTDGFYFMRVQGPGGVGPSHAIARVVLQRSHGRWSVHRDYYLRGACGVLTFAKIERPVFGGKQRYPLRFSYRLGGASRVSIIVRRGGKLIKSFGAHPRKAKRYYHVTVPLKKLPKGDYTVTAGVRRGKQRVVINLVSRRI